MFDSETRWFIRCDTCPDEPASVAHSSPYKDGAKGLARDYGWEIRDDLHRCPRCIREGRTEMVT